MGVASDFSFLVSPSGRTTARVDAIHRRSPGLDIYFVVNRDNQPVNVLASFNITGKVPELWYPGSGRCITDGEFSQDAGRTEVPLQLGPYGSIFVVFRHKLGMLNPVVTVKLNGDPVQNVEVTEGSGGGLSLYAAVGGKYELTMASGNVVDVTIPALPPGFAVHGPWRLAFTPGWGAPAAATFAHLMSWTDSHQSGIKYFSGTGTYRRDIEMPRAYIGSGNRVILHLGQVNDMAHVWVNGHDFGVLWHAPFRVDVTSAIKAGRNVLQIAVTNTWQNRLIGDDQQPSDIKWQKPSGHPLARFPSWVIHNAPRPCKNCYTFETWNFYRKASKLHPSGLLGP
ncbi:MAG: glycosylhydrolase-like jelly roll fold domain-containing protein, partial [Phycisphaerae bacterium]